MGAIQLWYQPSGFYADPSNSGSDTYDEPAGGRTTMNDTGDQTGKIIANTMEPKTAADVLARWVLAGFRRYLVFNTRRT